MLQQMLKDACEQSGRVGYRNNYSGRYMYGKSCVGVTGPRSECMKVVGEVIKELRENLKTVQLGSSEETQDDFFSQAIDLLLGDVAEDQMGMDVIVYWPRLEPLIDSEDDDA